MKNQFFELQKMTINDYILDYSQINQFSIYNNIDNLGMTISIIYNDVTDIKNKMPLIGNEVIDIIIVDGYNNKFSKKFYLTQVLETGRSSEKDVVITIKGVSQQSLLFSVNKQYINFNSKTFSSIVSSLTDSKMSCNITDNISFLSPGWSTTKCLQYLSTLSSTYLYFEDVSDYKFSKLEDIFKTLPSSDEVYKYNNNNPQYRYLVIDYKEKELFNTSSEMYNGMYSNKLYSFNPNTKAIVTKSTDVTTVQSENLTLGSGKNYTDISLNTNLFYNPYYSDTILKNQSDNNIKLLSWNKSLDVLTRGDFTKTIGKLINIQLKDRFNNNLNPQLNGYYLTTKTAWHFTAKDFVCKMEVQKNAWFKGDVKTNVV